MVRLSKRGVQIALGVLWLLDGALQFQHQMFTSSFATQVIAPAADGQPKLVSGPIHFGMHMFLLHPALFNTLFALTQLAIGALILWKRTAKLGLLGSVAWGLVVWAFGEGYGGIFSSHTLLLMGAPGAVILYVLLALAVLPSLASKRTQTAYWLVLVWLALWVGGGIYQLLPGQNSIPDVSSMIEMNAQGAPSWLATVDTHTVKAIDKLGHGHSRTYAQGDGMDMTMAQMTHMTSEPYVQTNADPGGLYILLFAVLQIAIGIGVLFGGVWRRKAVGLGIALSLVFWVVGQSLGGYYTGLATDPSSGPLFVILGLAILGCKDLDTKLSRLAARIQDFTVGTSEDKSKTA